ncbi:MAG: Chaperone protein DnaJ [Pseudomonadota bacterium]|jgi:sugar-specific transcriptional regulator TrmB
MIAPESAVSSSAWVSTALVRLGAAALPTARSPEVEKLQAQHEKLLGQVEKKRQVVEAAANEARSEEQRLASEVGRLQEQIRSARDELRSVFEFLVGAQSHLPKKERNKVRRLMRELFDDDPEPEDAEHEGDAIDSDWGGHRGTDAQPEPRTGQEAPRQRGPRPAPQVGSAHRLAEPPQLLRSLFKRLALALHPDRVQSEPERQARTRLMQEVTAAYGCGDLAALLAIEKRWMPASQPAASGDPREWVRRLRQANAELRSQLKSLADQLKELVQDPRPKTGAKRSQGTSVDPVVQHLNEIRFEAERLLEIARAFRAREISVTQFISAHYRRSPR